MGVVEQGTGSLPAQDLRHSPQVADWLSSPFTMGRLSQEDTGPSRQTDELFQVEPAASKWGWGPESAAQVRGPPHRGGPAGARWTQTQTRLATCHREESPPFESCPPLSKGPPL